MYSFSEVFMLVSKLIKTLQSINQDFEVGAEEDPNTGYYNLLCYQEDNKGVEVQIKIDLLED